MDSRTDKDMLKNYIIVAVRNLTRQKAYSLINILGLAVGMACCILILQYVRFEFAFDTHSSLADQTYHVLRETRRTDGQSTYSSGVSGPLSLAMKEEIPEVRDAVRQWGHGGVTFRSGEKRLQGAIAVVDSSFFGVFDMTVDHGQNPLGALSQPGTILIRRRSVEKFFGDEDPVGKTISVSDVICEGTFIVAGVLDALPTNTTIHYADFVTTHYPDVNYPRQHWDRWLPGTWRMTRIFAVLEEGASVQAVEAKLDGLMHSYLGPEVAEVDRYRLQHLPRTRLFSTADFGLPSPRRIEHIYTLVTVACLVIVVACVNFVNLSTARASRRAKEIGLRKTSGARRSQVARQFLAESCLTAGLGMLMALVFAQLMQPALSSFLGFDLQIGPDVLLYAIALALIIGLAAGTYPAVVLSGFDPVVVLKGAQMGTGSGWLRQGLTVVQFSISILLIVGTLIIQTQLAYVENQELGYDDEGIISMPFFSRGVSRREQSVIKETFEANPDILSVSLMSRHNFTRLKRRTIKHIDREHEQSVYQIEGDAGFLDMFRIPLLEGRNFRDRDLQALRRNGPDEFIVNRSAARALGFQEDESPVGAAVQIYGGDQKRLYKKDRLDGTIVGVVEDFHYQTLHEPIKPLIINPQYWVWGVLIRVKSGRLRETLTFCEETWYRFAPNIVFRYTFQDEHTKKAYLAEQQTAVLSAVSAGLAIFVGCLGLLGLAAFAAEQRAREIGIRKVLGASVASVLSLLSSEFVKLLLLANLIAWPLCYYIMRGWLDSFAYRVELGLGVFLGGGFLVVVVALLTVGYQTLKAASADPVKVLRSA
jgi:putative ABC transport system permease protein